MLAQPIGTEPAYDELLAIVSRVLRVRTAVLLDTTRELHQALTWAAAGIVLAELEEAREHARRMLEYLSRDGIVPTNVVGRTALLPGGVAEPADAPRQFITFPLLLGHGHVFGVFQVEGAVVFDERDLLFINTVAEQLGVAIDRHHARLELEASRSEVERANKRLRDLHTVARAALGGATLDDSLAAVLDAMCSMFATDAAAVLLPSADGKTLRRRSSVGLSGADDEILVGTGAAGRIAATGTAMAFDDLDELEGVSPTLRSHGIRSLLGAPMRARDRLIGVVQVASRDRRGFTHDELQLLELVADRIATIIDNARLYEQALAAIRSRDAVMEIVSHDLRNPLTAIHLGIQLIDQPGLTKPMSIIKRSVDVMIRLVSDLRDVGSIEAGHLSVRFNPEDARSLVRDAIEGVQAAAASKPVRLEARLPAQALVLDCDRVRVIQVLGNLLSNAIKFTPQGGSITVSLAESEPGYARFSVQDTGYGIPARDLPRVFDRYWQSKGTASLGSGLGLAIAKGIVEAHGGTMSVRSGHGTTFSFTLPLARGSASLAQP